MSQPTPDPASDLALADLEQLVRRSIDFYEALATAIGESVEISSRRDLLAQGTASVANEHGLSICTLVQGGQLASASVLLRAQFEAVTRAIWLHYCADEAWIEKYFVAVQGEPRKDPNISRGMDDMLKDIEAGAPARIAQMLRPLKAAAWGPLNSYVHSGIHAVVHQHIGPTPEFAIPTLLSSNGLTGMAAMLTAVMANEGDTVLAVARAQLDHRDCLPPVPATAA